MAEFSPISMTIPDAAAYVGLGRSTIYELMGKGEIASAKVGSRRLVIRESLDLFIERNTLN